MWQAPRFPGRILLSPRERGSSGSRRSPLRRRSAVFRLERLEDRLVLSSLTVSNNSDIDAPGSLRYAINYVNASSDTSNTITIDSTLTGGQTIGLDSALPQITNNVEIDGPGAGLVSVSGNDHSRVFDISPGTTVTISDLTITHGMADKDSPDVPSLGGGILNSGNLTLSEVVVSDSLAIGDASANPRYMNVYLGPGVADGGGVYNGGTLHVSQSTFTRNQARGGSDSGGVISLGSFPGASMGGGLANAGEATVEDSQFTSNLTQGGNNNRWVGMTPFAGVCGGGAIANTGIIAKATLNVSGSTFTHNQAVGGDKNLSRRVPGIALGGALYSQNFTNGAVLNLSDSTFDHNQAIGGSYNEQTGPVSLAIGPNIGSGGGALIAGPATISGSTVEHNQAIGGQGLASSNGGEGHGGGFSVSFTGTTVTVTDCTVEHNQAIGGQAGAGGVGGKATGGGILNEAGAMLTVTGSSIDYNQAQGGSADTSSPASSGNGLGGGVYNDSGTTISVTDSSLAHNLAKGAPGSNGGKGGDGLGGGFYNGGTATLTGNVIEFNLALGGEAGSGGIDGQGIGGGVYSIGTLMPADITKVNVIRKNRASTSNPDVYRFP